MAILNLQQSIFKSKKHNAAKFNYLPKHIISDILARVASTSFADLFSAKTTCKELFEAGSDDYIFEHAAIDSFPVIPWKKMSDGASCFLEKCMRCENPESLFRQGMIDYFSNLNYDSGIEYLKRASEKGLLVAKYVYFIIVRCYGGEFRKEDLIETETETETETELNWVVKECRERVKEIIKLMWVNNYMVGIGPKVEEEFKKKRRNCCCRKSTVVINGRKSTGWTEEDEFDDNVSCDDCLWDIEVTRFLSYVEKWKVYLSLCLLVPTIQF